MKTVNLGGDRLGSGSKMNVNLKGFERSSHDLSFIWRSTMASGTLVPFINLIGLPGDSFRMNLNADVKTYPTVGPLFGSFKLQLDVFTCPIRLYQGKLHNNKLGIGLEMDKVKLPVFNLTSKHIDFYDKNVPVELQHLNPSSLLSYLGIKGVLGSATTGVGTREYNALSLLSYVDIYKNYYANKQEGIGAMLCAANNGLSTITGILWYSGGELMGSPNNSEIKKGDILIIQGNNLNFNNLEFQLTSVFTPAKDVSELIYNKGNEMKLIWTSDASFTFEDAAYNIDTVGTKGVLDIVTFDLENIDTMRETILSKSLSPNAFNVGVDCPVAPYNLMIKHDPETNYLLSRIAQHGLLLKTYNSDIFNNWLSSDFINGINGISAVTAVDTSSGSFTIDTLNLSKKVYDMLNRIAVSGGSYDDWLESVYDYEIFGKTETPVYVGGMSQEVVFQQVISQSDTSDRPLGSLAGRGNLVGEPKGGYIDFKISEPSVIIGIASLTPRIDYSQGNDWSINLKTMNDFHKPSLSQIGFQNLITENMAFWDTDEEQDGSVRIYSAGQQPAWINYMTNFNKCFGEFANPDTEMFMTLNRRYEADPVTRRIKDLTTYIDPSKFNYIFAVQDISAQNFWTQIGVDIEARRKMSAKSIPNL